MRVRVIAMLAAGVLLAACTSDDPSVSPSPSPAASIPPAGWIECTNPIHGYSISYPEDWYTTSTSDENACRWFDRSPFELREGTEAPTTDLIVMPIDRPYDEHSAVIGAAPDERLIVREQTRVAGRDALRFEVEQTGDGFYPAGVRFFGFLVDAPDGSLLIETIDVGGAPYAENQEILLTAASTLAF